MDNYTEFNGLKFKKNNSNAFNNDYIDIGGLKVRKDIYEKRGEYQKAANKRRYEEEEKKKYHFGDITKGILSSGADLALDIGEGFLGTLEGVTDWGTYRIADIGEAFGADDFAKDLRGNADFNSTGALFGKNEKADENLFQKDWTKGIEESSIFNDTFDQIFQGVGNVGALAATSIVSGGSSLATIGASYTSAYGAARSKAKREGASDRDANRVGIINGIAEALSEQFFEGMPGMKVEGWGSKLTGKFADKVSKYFGSGAGKIALKTFDSMGEGFEEIISNSLVAVGNDLMHYYDSNFTYGMENQTGNLLIDSLAAWTDSESWSNFFSAAMTSALLGSARSVIDNRTQNKIINAYAKDNNMSFKDAKYILTGQTESAKQEIIRDKGEYNSNVELEKMAKQRILNYMRNTTGQNIESEIEKQITQQEEELGTKFSNEQKQQMRIDIRSMYEDRINSQDRYTEFTLDKEPTDEREKKLYESFKQNNRNNTKAAHDVYNFIKTLQDNNPTSNYRLTSNEELAKLGKLQRIEENGKVKYALFSKEGKRIVINGFKKGNTIYINADAKNPYQAVLGHEIGEAIKASDNAAYNDLKQLVKQVYGEGNLKRYQQIYDDLSDNVEDEYVNDRLGEMFQNNKLIDKISDNRNLLQKLIDEVKRLIKYIKSNNEQKQLQKLQKTLEDKYIELYKQIDFTSRTNKNLSNSRSRYSLSIDEEMIDNTTGEKVTFDVQPVETSLPTNKTLMAIHNLNEDKLNGVLDLGGFPVPSIAITNPGKVNHNQFGDISVIFDKETINPANRLNEVYDRDVWSPTFPTIEYELNDDVIERVAKDLGIEEWRLRDAAEDNSKPEYLIDRLLREEKIIDKFINDNNIEYETAYKNAATKVDMHQRGDKLRKFIIDNDFDFRKLYKDAKLQQEYFDLIKDYYDNSTLPAAVKENIYNEKILQLKNYIDIQKGAGDLEPVRQLKRYQDDFDLIKSGDNKVIDEWQTEKNKKQVAIDNGIESYLSNEIKDVYGDKGIRNDKEYLTPSGNRRSFWQLHDEYNIENIVDALTKDDTTGTQNWFAGYGQIQANMANQFNSIEEIKQNENRLVDLSNNNEQLEEARANIENDIDEIVARNDTDMSIVSELLADFARGELTKDNFRKLTKNTYQTTQNVSDELLEKTINDLKTLKDLPTDYFEAKPQRAVGLDEIGAVVIPSNVDESLKQRLTDNNIQYTEYNPEVEGDRQRAINEYEQYMFSLGLKKQNQTTGFENTQKIKDYTDYVESLNVPTTDRLGILTKEDYTNKKKELYEQYVDRAANKIEEQVKDVAKRNLELKNKDIADLRAITDKYKEMSREDIYSSNAKEELRQFVKDHSHQEYEEQIINNEIRDLQKDIRNREFIISNDYKGEFPDGLTKFKKNNPGINIKFGQKGNLDTELQELAELYPAQIDADVAYGDIPFVLADIMKQEYKQSKLEEFNLTDEEIDNITNKMFFGLTNNALSDKDIDKFVTTIQDKIRNKYARQMAIKEYRQLAKDMIGDISQIKDKKRGLLYQINTMKRNLRDIMTPEQASKMYDVYFKPISIHNAQIETDINEYNERISKYNLNNEESTYTQMLGELKYNPKTSLTTTQVDDYLQKHKNKIDTKKVNSAIEEFREIYDELIVRVNESLEANGYKPIDYRTGYFPHFIEDKADTMLGKFAEKLGWQVKKGQLPTDIAGLTDEFQPGKVWTSFSQQRTGDATDYNALKGMDNYLRGAMDVIYHTQDIQRLRALEAEIRYQYSDKGVQQKLDEIYNNQDLTNEEKYAQAALVTENVKDNPLGNFATELRNYTNNLANKKAIGDRGMEQTLGRDMYSIMNNISSRVSANMVGANISSAMTNFIPLTQAWSQIKTKNMLKGILSTIKASIRDDGFSQNSVYLTNRTKQAEKLFKTKLEKAVDVLGKPFEAVDSFTSNVIVRAKYFENLEKGMNEVDAMNNADEFAKDVMAGRSKGDSPTMFNKKNPLAKLFTAFQLEVNNQYGYMFKDIKVDIGKEAKDKLAMAFMKLFLGAWIYNMFSEKITGRKAAFSPIDMVADEAKIITNENMDLATKLQNLSKNIVQEAPFVGGIMGGGRLPIQSAIPYSDPVSFVTETATNVGGLFDDEKREKAINSLIKEWSKPLYFVALPVAGGQIKKSVEGMRMYTYDTPGSYTDSGKIRFEADTSPLGMLQSFVFGQYASENAREYFDSGASPLTEKQLQEAQDANLPLAEYREINRGINRAKKIAKDNKESQSEAQYDYIYNLPISMEQKNSLLNSKLKASNNVEDDNGYVKYTDGNNNYWYDAENDIVYNSKYRKMNNIDISDLTKYSNLKDISDYGNYSSLEEYNYAYNNPEKYAAIQQVTNYNNYIEYRNEITAIKDDYNNGTEKGRKLAQQKVFDYINSLPLNQYQKVILQKLAGGYSIKSYEKSIFDYINKQDLTKEEKQKIHKELFGNG